MGSHSLLQEIFPTQGSKRGLPQCRQILYQLNHKGSPGILEWIAYPFSSGSSQPMYPALKAESLPSELPGNPKNTGVGSLSLLQRSFLTQELNWGLLHCRWILHQLSYHGSPLNKKGDNIQPCHTPFPILSQLEYKLILFGGRVV